MTPRIGLGYDTHALVSGRKLVLGGVDIPCEKGLLGHSDADVLTHAIMDALLGAAALADIGSYFPDSDAQYKGISSITLLQHVGGLLEQEGLCVGNIDAVIICQQPKLAPHRDAMRKNIAIALNIPVCNVGIKATTTEGLGPEGRGEGISAQAAVLLFRSEKFQG